MVAYRQSMIYRFGRPYARNCGPCLKRLARARRRKPWARCCGCCRSAGREA